MKIKSGDKLYVITRRDLSPGYQAVQSIHAAQTFAVRFPDINGEWYNMSNYLALLSVVDESALKRLYSRAHKSGLKACAFIEPDIGFKITAIAIEPSKRTKELCKSLPLALKYCRTIKRRK